VVSEASRIQGMKADENAAMLAATVFVPAERFNTDEIDPAAGNHRFSAIRPASPTPARSRGDQPLLRVSAPSRER
jgi:hypothetical protein